MNKKASVGISLLGFCANLASCSYHTEEQIPLNSKIIAKYRVLDERISPNIAKCSNTRKDFLNAGRYDCSFKLNGLEFIIDNKYITDKNGRLKEYWSYYAEGPAIYTQKELKEDAIFAREEGLNNFYLAFLNRKEIIDGRDTITIQKIFPKKKLFFITRDNRDSMNGRRIIYEYR